MTEAEVGVKLVLDDHASAAIEKIKGGFEKVGEKVNEVQHELTGMLKQAAAVAIGFQFDRGLESLKSLGEEALNAATGSAKQIKNLAGVLALTDKTGMSFEAATEQATGFKEELEAMAIKAGVSADSVIDAFSTIAERSGKSREEVMKLTGEMTQASKALPGGIGQMAGAFQQLESGIVRPRNALVQMIKQTGVATGSAKDISKKLSQMVQAGNVEGATKLAEDAISRMAKKMENAPPTFEGLVQSLKDIRENLFEAFGVPMLQTILPHLASFKKYILENKEKIEEFAKAMGVKVGEWVNKAAEKIQEGFEYVKNHAKEIEEAITNGANMLIDAVKFIIAHKEEIALMYGASKIPAGIGMAKGAISTAATLGKGALSFGGMLAGGGLEVAGIAASTAALGAFAAAIGSVGLAAKMGYDLNKQLDEEKKQEQEARLDALMRIAQQGDQLSGADQAGYDKILGAGIAADPTGGFRAQADKIWEERKAAMEIMRQADDAWAHGTIDPMVAAYNKAVDSNNVAAMKFISGMISDSDMLREGMIEAGDKVHGGSEGMLAKLGKWLTPGAKDDIIARTHPIQTEKPDKLNATFTGPITIKQDFRDQDPDRVAIVFKRDLERAASSRVGSVLGGRTGM
jgi:hypothetical protein